jgi:uncharacterized protein (TIGR00297 family)
MPTWTRVLEGFVLASGVAGAAYYARALSVSGALAAVAIGTLAVAAGWSWGALLIAYFVSSSTLSHFRAEDKRARAGDRTEKQGARDAAQVLANGVLFAGASIAYVITGSPLCQMIGAAALAASAADTWATEIGILAASPPRSMVTGRVVPPGTSGGFTWLGLAASGAGASFVASVAWLARWPATAILSALIGGVAGSVIDSVIGATLQARRRCVFCAADTERRVHDCGRTTELAGGVFWMDNDSVNALSTVGGALVGVAAAGAAAAGHLI